jgi:predicted transcriptional regulator
MIDVRAHRTALGTSQSKLARLAHVSRFKLANFELGGGSLTAEEQQRICDALRFEAARLRLASSQIDLGSREGE